MSAEQAGEGSPDLGRAARAATFLIVDTTGMESGLLAQVQPHAVPIPAEWVGVVSDLATVPARTPTDSEGAVPAVEADVAHGVLASDDDLAADLRRTMNYDGKPTASRREATSIWNVLTDHVAKVESDTSGRTLTLTPDLARVGADLFRRLFVTLPGTTARRLDINVLHQLLLPLPEDNAADAEGSLMENLGVVGISDYRVKRLSGFVNRTLNLSPEEALAAAGGYW